MFKARHIYEPSLSPRATFSTDGLSSRPAGAVTFRSQKRHGAAASISPVGIRSLQEV